MPESRPTFTREDVTALREMLADASEWIDERYSEESKQEHERLWRLADAAVERIAESLGR